MCICDFMQKDTHVCMHKDKYMYIYIYICVKRLIRLYTYIYVRAYV